MDSNALSEYLILEDSSSTEETNDKDDVISLTPETIKLYENSLDI